MTDNGAGAPGHSPNEAGLQADPDALVSTGPQADDAMAALAKEAADFRDRWMRAMASSSEAGALPDQP